MQGPSQSILDESLSMWKEEREYDTSEAEERIIPTGDTDDSSNARRENDNKEGQCVQNAAYAQNARTCD